MLYWSCCSIVLRCLVSLWFGLMDEDLSLEKCRIFRMQLKNVEDFFRMLKTPLVNWGASTWSRPSSADVAVSPRTWMLSRRLKGGLAANKTCMNQLYNSIMFVILGFHLKLHIYSLLVERLAAGFPWPQNFARASEKIGNSLWECWRRRKGPDLE